MRSSSARVYSDTRNSGPVERSNGRRESATIRSRTSPRSIPSTPTSSHARSWCGVTHGLTRYCLSVLPRLDPGIVQVTACFLREPHPAAEALRSAGCRTVFLGRGRWDSRALTDVLWLIRRERSAIVHAAGQKGILVGRSAARIAGCKALIHLHDLYRPHPAVRALLRATAGWTDLALAVSHVVASHALTEYGLSEDRVQVLYNGIEPAAFMTSDPDAGRRWRSLHDIGEAEPVIGIIGRIVPLKGHARLIAQMPRILARFSNARLVIVGDGPLRRDLERQTRELGLEAAVRFVGQQDDIASVLAACDVVAVPSDHEGVSIVALEAMAAGKPVVASNVGGLREVLAGGACGILFDLDDETALGDAIVAILSDPARARRLVAAGARQVERFSVERHALELQKVYLRLAGRAVESGA